MELNIDHTVRRSEQGTPSYLYDRTLAVAEDNFTQETAPKCCAQCRTLRTLK